MKIFSQLLTFSLLVFALGACERDRATQGTGEPLQGPGSNPPPSDPPSATNESRVRLYLFAAGGCVPCKKELPMVRDWMDTTMAEKKSRVLPLVLYTAGNPMSIPAKQSDADQFKADLQIPFPILADKYGKDYYRKFFPTGSAVPATVLLKEDYTVIKVYTPDKELNLDQLAADINEALQ